ncbi:MAG: DNA-processing protein DprA [Selenomonadaceae bacterium]|nr:DNA-processing protein DprA [Selenomonadaceae bacterium]
MEKYFMAAMGGADGFGNKSIEKLINFCGSAKAAWSSDIDDIVHAGIQSRHLEAFVAFRGKHPNAPENLVKYCERHEFNLCSINDEDYPPILKEIDSPPMFFYYRGKLQPHVQRIGIVGSRHNTPYGQNVALQLAEELAAAGLTVVSGAARGIDTFAHRGALKSGRTVAVLGCGIDIAFRSGKRKFLEEIAETGVVLSEFPPQLPPNTGTFPTRNRIIAGLSLGIVVVEADFKSGALITSTYAGDYGRDVFAVPGQVYAQMSRGCNELIRDGATLIKSAQDILNEYDIAVKDKPESEPISLDDAEAKVLEVIPFDNYITSDEILMKLDDLDLDEIDNILINLEMKKCIEDNFGRYKRNAIKSKPAKKISLDDTEAKVLEVIPFDNYITSDEILMKLDDLDLDELDNILINLDLKKCIEENLGRYKRKIGG